MSDALVLFAHGARNAEWGAPLLRLAAAIGLRAPALPVTIAYLEFQEPSLPVALGALAGGGARRIDVMPVFWANAGHVARDAPMLIDAARQAHPGLQVRLLPPLSELPGLIEWLADRAAGMARE